MTRHFGILDREWFQPKNFGNRPVHCEDPHGPEDVLYSGSDDDAYNDPDERRTRYEEKAQQFLDGKPMFLLSASLQGPFDKESGWTNPWRSKSTPETRSKKRKRTTATGEVVRDNKSTWTGQSSPVHLTGNESDVAAPSYTPHRYMKGETLDRVRSWRDEVVKQLSADEAAGTQSSLEDASMLVQQTQITPGSSAAQPVVLGMTSPLDDSPFPRKSSLANGLGRSGATKATSKPVSADYTPLHHTYRVVKRTTRSNKSTSSQLPSSSPPRSKDSKINRADKITASPVKVTPTREPVQFPLQTTEARPQEISHLERIGLSPLAVKIYKERLDASSRNVQQSNAARNHPTVLERELSDVEEENVDITFMTRSDRSFRFRSKAPREKSAPAVAITPAANPVFGDSGGREVMNEIQVADDAAIPESMAVHRQSFESESEADEESQGFDKDEAVRGAEMEEGADVVIPEESDLLDRERPQGEPVMRPQSSPADPGDHGDVEAHEERANVDSELPVQFEAGSDRSSDYRSANDNERFEAPIPEATPHLPNLSRVAESEEARGFDAASVQPITVQGAHEIVVNTGDGDDNNDGGMAMLIDGPTLIGSQQSSELESDLSSPMSIASFPRENPSEPLFTTDPRTPRKLLWPKSEQISQKGVPVNTAVDVSPDIDVESRGHVNNELQRINEAQQPYAYKQAKSAGPHATSTQFVESCNSNMPVITCHSTFEGQQADMSPKKKMSPQQARGSTQAVESEPSRVEGISQFCVEQDKYALTDETASEPGFDGAREGKINTGRPVTPITGSEAKGTALNEENNDNTIVVRLGSVLESPVEHRIQSTTQAQAKDIGLAMSSSPLSSIATQSPWSKEDAKLLCSAENLPEPVKTTVDLPVTGARTRQTEKRLAASQRVRESQSPWAEQTETVARATSMPAAHTVYSPNSIKLCSIASQALAASQSPWAKGDSQIAPLPDIRPFNPVSSPACSPGGANEAQTPELPFQRSHEDVEMSNSQQHIEPHPPSTPETKVSSLPTPEFTLSIKSFREFMTPSPQRPTKRQRLSLPADGGRLPSTQILVDAAISNPWTGDSSSRMNRQRRSGVKKPKRVSWALLPGEEGQENVTAQSEVGDNSSPSRNEIIATSTPASIIKETPRAGHSQPSSQPLSRSSRAASPPLDILVTHLPTADEKFGKHFAAVANRRLSNSSNIRRPQGSRGTAIRGVNRSNNTTPLSTADTGTPINGSFNRSASQQRLLSSSMPLSLRYSPQTGTITKTPRHKTHLLPSASQQVCPSPAFEAMAEAFMAADDGHRAAAEQGQVQIPVLGSFSSSAPASALMAPEAAEEPSSTTTSDQFETSTQKEERWRSYLSSGTLYNAYIHNVGEGSNNKSGLAAPLAEFVGEDDSSSLIAAGRIVRTESQGGVAASSFDSPMPQRSTQSDSRGRTEDDEDDEMLEEDSEDDKIVLNVNWPLPNTNTTTSGSMSQDQEEEPYYHDEEQEEEEEPSQRTETQIDDVSAVLTNLDDYLQSWDVDAELAKASRQSQSAQQTPAAAASVNDGGSGSNFTAAAGLMDVGVWD